MSNISITYLEWAVLRFLCHRHLKDPKTPLGSFRIIQGEVWFFEKHITQPALRAAKSLVKKGYIGEPDTFGNRRPNEAGLQAAQSEAPALLIPPPPRLDSEDIALLKSMARFHMQQPAAWQSPKLLGGSDGPLGGGGRRPRWPI